MQKRLQIISNLIRRNRTFLVFFLLSVSIYSLWWFAFFPGILSPDSNSQLKDANTFMLTDWHPYISTLLIWVLQKIWHAPAVVALFQIIWTSALFSWILAYSIRSGARKILIYLLFLGLITSIPISLYNITIWKDIPFSLIIIHLSFLLATFKRTAVTWTSGHVVKMLILTILAIQLRHNGMIYLGLVPLICLIAFYRQGKRIITYIGALICSILILQFLVPPLLNVKPAPFWFKDMFVYHLSIGFYAQQPETLITPKTQELLESSLPNTDLKKAYDPRYFTALWNKNLQRKVIDSPLFWQELKFEFFHHNLWANFNTFIEDRTIMMKAVLNGESYVTEITEDQGTSLLPKLRAPLNEMLKELTHNYPTIRTLVFGSWIGLLLLILGLPIGIVRKRYDLVIFSLIPLAQIPALFVFGVAADWRYLYFIYLSIFAILPLVLTPKKSKEFLTDK